MRSALMLCLQAAVILAAACTASPESPIAGDGSDGSIARGGNAGSSTGVGGAGGRAGEGSAGSGGGAAALPDWLFDRDAWEPIPGAPSLLTAGCEVKVGRMDRIHMSPLRWVPCGPACELADVVQGIGDSASFPVLTTHTDATGAARAFLRVLHKPVIDGPANVALRRIVDLESGKTVAALRQAPPDKCLPALTTDSSALAIELLLTTNKSDLRKVLGAWDPATKSWSWMRPWPKNSDVPLYPNTILESPLYRLFTCEQIVFANLEPGSSELVRIAELPDTFATTSGGNAELLLWAEVFLRHSESRLIRWVPGATEHEVFIEGIDGDICKIDVGGETVGGFLVRADGKRSCNLTHKDTRFFRLHAPKKDSKVELGPRLPGKLLAFDFALTSSHMAAAVGDHSADDLPATALVTRIDDWRTRKLYPRDGYHVREIAVSDRYLYVIETPANKDFLRYWEVRRYDLERMDEWGVEVETIP